MKVKQSDKDEVNRMFDDHPGMAAVDAYQLAGNKGACYWETVREMCNNP